jgi:hypothetical protein
MRVAVANSQQKARIKSFLYLHFSSANKETQ